MRALAVVALVLAAAPPSASAQAAWHEVRSEPCRFAASFPGLVAEHERGGEVAGAAERRFTAVDGDLGFAVYCSVLPAGTLDGVDPAGLLDHSVAGMGPGTATVEAVRNGGHEGRAFVVPMGDGYVYGQTYVVGDVILMLQVTGPAATSAAPPAAARRFFGSLVLAGAP